MNALSQIKNRFKPVLDSMVDDSADLLGMIRPAKDSSFGDYQGNCAMPMKNLLGKSSREIANEIVNQLDIKDLCQSVEVAGPGFINLKLDDDWLLKWLDIAFVDERLAVGKVGDPQIIVVDFSSPNVAKPMHVGHIRSTLIGDSISRILRFVGHTVITDNHLGDWGTQFGMIIYGYKHFLDRNAYSAAPVQELGRLYKLVRRIIDYHAAVASLPEAAALLVKQQAALVRVSEYESTGDKIADSINKKDRLALATKIEIQTEQVESLKSTIASVRSDAQLGELVESHADIAAAVLQETALLHSDDPWNQRLWNEFLPVCRADIQRIYDRLDVQFDHELGESFYHLRLAAVVEDLERTKLASESQGAICVFLDGFDAPMLIRKKDGAFLYATTDLATIRYRMDEWRADVVLYVVDHRQHEHFDKLFAAAEKWGYRKSAFQHVSFGTVLGDDGKPYKTRSGDTVGLEGLLDEAVFRARKIAAEQNPDLTDSELDGIANIIGIGGLKYIDLSQNRSSDYRFSYEKMLALKGNTATYLQYGYARVQGILRKGGIDIDQLRTQPVDFMFSDPVERRLALSLSRFSESLDETLVEYKPNILAGYLFELTQVFFQFFDQCPVLKTEDESLRKSRLQFCDLTARTLKTGLWLLGIRVVDKM